MAILKAGGVDLPDPVSISANDEIIWSTNTGRSTTGDMVGDVVTQKKNITITWGILQESEVSLIKNYLAAGFFSLSFRDDGIDLTIQVYRGTLTKEHIGRLGDGIYWYRSASCSLIQQ